jgi:hypothetical protein
MLTALLCSTALTCQAQIKEEDVKKAEAALVANSDDTGAHLVLGKFLCFQKDDWIVGVPHLAKGSDAALKAAAAKELSEPSQTGPEKIGIGDAWIDASKKVPAHRRAIQERAAFWYGQAWPDLEGPWKEKMKARLRALFQTAFQPPKVITGAGGWSIAALDAKATRTNAAWHTGQFSYGILCWKHPLPSYVPISQPVTVKMGQQCKMSVWVLSDDTDPTSASFRIHVQNAEGTNILIHGVPIPPDQPWWQKIEYTFVIPVGAVRASLDVAVGSRQGTIFLDDFSLTLDGKEQVKNPSFEEK